MKVRQGFVSNSSSSSFIMYGVKVKQPRSENKYDELTNLIDDSELSYEVEDGNLYIGKHIADIDDGVSKISLSDDESVKVVETIIEICDKVGIKPKENDFGIYAGTAYH